MNFITDAANNADAINALWICIKPFAVMSAGIFTTMKLIG